MAEARDDAAAQGAVEFDSQMLALNLGCGVSVEASHKHGEETKNNAASAGNRRGMGRTSNKRNK
jgi:hypothetical protein